MCMEKPAHTIIQQFPFSHKHDFQRVISICQTHTGDLSNYCFSPGEKKPAVVFHKLRTGLENMVFVSTLFK